MAADFSQTENGDRAGIFATTHWSLVFQAGHERGEETLHALEALCRAYWYPIYAYVRRLGHAPHDAQDTTQSFFAYLLEKRLIAKAQPESGRFRSFLLGSLKNFMANEWRRQTALKRGGRALVIDTNDAEDRYAHGATEQKDPQTLYEQAWAEAVLDQSIVFLEAEYGGAGKQSLFNVLLPTLQGDHPQFTYSRLGEELGMSEGAVKVAAHRLRQRYRELVRAAVANTVSDPLEVDGELRHLMQVLSRS